MLVGAFSVITTSPMDRFAALMMTLLMLTAPDGGLGVVVEEHDGVELAGLGGPVQPGPLLQQAEAGRVPGLHRVAEGELRHQLLHHKH